MPRPKYLVPAKIIPRLDGIKKELEEMIARAHPKWRVEIEQALRPVIQDLEEAIELLTFLERVLG